MFSFLITLTLLVQVQSDGHGGEERPAGPPAGRGRAEGDGAAGPPSLISPAPGQHNKTEEDCPPRTGREWVCRVSGMGYRVISYNIISISSYLVFSQTNSQQNEKGYIGETRVTEQRVFGPPTHFIF